MKFTIKTVPWDHPVHVVKPMQPMSLSRVALSGLGLEVHEWWEHPRGWWDSYGEVMRVFWKAEMNNLHTFYFHPYLGRWSNLTKFSSNGWFNHQLGYKREKHKHPTEAFVKNAMLVCNERGYEDFPGCICQLWIYSCVKFRFIRSFLLKLHEPCTN